MPASDKKKDDPAEIAGLRVRKKARRREEILSEARKLFAKKGIQATTMAEIAEAVQVSPPTVFNYFGNKDGILIALITEGSVRSRESRAASGARNDTDFCSIVMGLMSEISHVTLDIADKRVWRYAEAAAIRHPTTDLALKYAANDRALRDSLSDFFAQYEIEARAPKPTNPEVFGRLFFDVWNSAFFELIKDEDMTLDQHLDGLSARVEPLCELLFSDAFLASPTLGTRKN